MSFSLCSFASRFSTVTAILHSPAEAYAIASCDKELGEFSDV